MANSGITKVKINNLERALSSDQNLIQSEISTAFMEIWRQLYGSDAYVPGLGTPNGVVVEEHPETTESNFALRSIIPGGLLVNPQGANMHVDAGLLCTILTPSSDESAFVLARSEGLSGTELPFVTNGGAGPRWDLVECRPRVTTTQQTRDIFDPVTQQFTSQSVDKVITTDLEFQYNQGTAGSPAASPVPTVGWQPLAAVWVPTSATSFDDCEVFDTRPTVMDLADPGMFRVGNRDNVQPNHEVWWDVQTDSSGASRLGGDGQSGISMPGAAPSQYDWTAAPFNTNPAGFGRKGYNISGYIRATNPNTSAIGVGVGLNDGISGAGDTGDYMVSGVTYQNENWYSVNLVFPFGLARFRKFANFEISGRRWPLEMNGLVTLSNPTNDHIGNTRGVSLPSAYDTEAKGFDAILIGQVRAAPAGWGSGNLFHSAQLRSDGWYYPMDDSNGMAADSVAGGDTVVFWSPSAIANDLPGNLDFDGKFVISTTGWTVGSGYTVAMDIELSDDGTAMGGNNFYERFQLPIAIEQPGAAQLFTTTELYAPWSRHDASGTGVRISIGGGQTVDNTPSGHLLEVTRIRMGR